MLYRTQVPISYMGDRVEKGVELEMDPKEAANLGTDVVAVDGPTEPVEAPVEEKAIDEMTKDELVEKAASLGLPTTGTKADLIEKITLHVEGGGDDQPEEEVEE